MAKQIKEKKNYLLLISPCYFCQDQAKDMIQNWKLPEISD